MKRWRRQVAQCHQEPPLRDIDGLRLVEVRLVGRHQGLVLVDGDVRRQVPQGSGFVRLEAEVGPQPALALGDPEW